MELGDKWEWRNRKLACRIAPETGNPAGDDLRERFAELAGKDLDEMNKIFDTLESMKNTKKKKEVEKKGVHIDHKGDKKFKEVLTRKHILGATQLAVMNIDEEEHKMATTVTQKNLKKQFARLPVSPPPRVLLEIQRERSKPPTVVDSDDILAKRAKLEKKLEKQRVKRMLAMKANEKETKVGNGETSETTHQMLSNTFAVHGNGDLFGSNGDYLNSMMYMSRMAGTLEKSQKMKLQENTLNTMNREDGFITDKGGKNKNILDEAKNGEKDGEDDAERGQHDEGDENQSQGSQNAGTDASAKLYCVVSLCNWSRNSGNAQRLIQEGGVRAIMQLLQEHSVRIRRFAAAALRFMSEDPLLSIALIEEGAVGTISDIVKVPIDEFSATNLAVCLINLTRINGREAMLVEGSTVLCLHNLIMNAPELASLCARGLYNLTCVDSMYPLMERLIRTIISISSSNVQSVKHICAAALCNLSDLKLMRPRLIEEGCIGVLGTIARHAPTRTRRVCAVILQNLSATRSCRVEMVIRSSVHVAHGLSSDKDPIILRCVGLTLARLSTEPVNATRIVQEYGVAAIINIAMKSSDVAGISQPISTALQLLSTQPSTRVAVVQEGCVTSIAQLLHTSKDPFTLQNALHALSNLLIEHENHLPIVQQGLILTLVNMSNSNDDKLKELCALAFFNMSCSGESHKHIVNAGAIASLINLSQQNVSVTKQRCAAALCNVSAYESGTSRMVGDGIIPALVKLLSEDDITIHYSCAALCRLCSTQENSEIISQSGGVPSLVEGTLKGPKATKQFCGAVLSALSFYEVCRSPLCDFGAIAAFKSLSELNDEVAHQRCLIAFANISCEESVRERMVEEGVVSICASLIGNSYQEKNYICCAKTLCNLACAEKTRLMVAQQGGVHALLMISMVHSVDRQTKLLCVLALYNLLDANTVNFMLDEGISTSIANLTKLGEPRILNLCSKMFNYLTRFVPAMEKLAERSTLTYSAICTLIDDDDADTKMIGSRTISNLILCKSENVSSVLIENGAFESLSVGCTVPDLNASMQCIAALFSSCKSSDFLAKMGHLKIVNSLLSVALKGNHTEERVYIYISKIVAMIAMELSSRPSLRNQDTVKLLTSFIIKNTNTTTLKSVECGKWLARALQHICNGYLDINSFMQCDVLNALLCLHELNDQSGVISASAAETFRLVLHSSTSTGDIESFIFQVSSPNTQNILHRAVVQAKENNDTYTIYNVAVVFYELTNYNSQIRLECATSVVADIMNIILDDASSNEISSCIMFQFFTDNKSRSVFSSQELSLKLTQNILKKSDTNQDTIYNIISAFWSLSKLASTREMLASPEVNLDQIALELSRTENPKLKANCARLLKNLSSDANEAIEEGAVAALIAISLEGKTQRNKVGNEMKAPDIRLMAQSMELDDLLKLTGVDVFDGAAYVHYEEKETTAGGSAGRGPGLPEPPSMESTEKNTSAFNQEDLDGNEVEGKAKMSFAKMQVPNEVKSQHLLQDDDFTIKDDDASATEDTGLHLGTKADESCIAGGFLDGSASEVVGEIITGEVSIGGPVSGDESAGAGAAAAPETPNNSKTEGKESSHSIVSDKSASASKNIATGKKGSKATRGPNSGNSKPNTPSKKTNKSNANAHTTEVEKSNKEMGAKAASLGLYK
jgi:hypothetical protein